MGNSSTKSDGALNQTSTADDVVKHLGADLARGKTIVITGANGGLGFESARVFSANGAEVVLCARSDKNGNEAVAKIKATYPDSKVSYMQLDLGSHASIRQFAKVYKESGKPIHVLLNNAGKNLFCAVNVCIDV